MKRVIVLACALACGCGTTGSALVSFLAQAGGPADITSPAQFMSGDGYAIELTSANMIIGAIYLNESVVLSGMQETSCLLPTTDLYVGEAFGPVGIDLLSPDLVHFPTAGSGTQTLAKTAQVWLTSGDVNADTDTTVILEVAGVATRAATTTTTAVTVPFTASVTISQNRAEPVQNPAFPGSNPICEKRIVSPIAVNLTPSEGGTLDLRIDPRGMFDEVDFVQLLQLGATPPYAIPDSPNVGLGGIGGALFDGMRSQSGVYEFSFTP